MTEDQELRACALHAAIRALSKRGEPFTVEDVRVAAQRFYGFMADTQSEEQRLGLAPTQLTQQARPMTPEEFRAHYGEQQGAVGSPRGLNFNQQDHDAEAERRRSRINWPKP